MAKWIILRGLGRESAHWLEFGELLSRNSEQVMSLDLPGAGLRNKEKSPITISGITEKVRSEFLEKKNEFEKDWNLLGISLGGMVALDWVARYPYDFQNLVVINTSSKDTGPIWQRLTAFGWYKMIQAMAMRDLRQREKAILEMVSNLRKNDHALLDQLVEIAKGRPISTENLARQLMASANFMAPEKVKIPTLILASLKDHMVDVRCSKMLAEHLGAQIKFHPDAGHELTMDDPRWVMERLEEFVGSRTKDQVLQS
jgi:pimeloyl-ACP methyl ester carboxylesterase